MVNGIEWTYRGHYCKYCKRCYSSRYINRHNKTDAHKNNQIFYKHENIREQIKNRLISDFREGRYDPDDVNLKGEERKQRFKQLKKEVWKKFDEAERDGYFDNFDFDEEIDFDRYNLYHQMGIKLNRRKEVFADDEED